MNKSEKVRAAEVAKMSELADLGSLCEREDRSPTEEERTLATKLEADVSALRDEAKFLARSADAKTWLNDSTSEVVKPSLKETNSADENQFENSADFYRAVMHAARPGATIDQRLLTRAVSGMSEGTDADGGYLVDQGTAKGITKTLWSSGLVLPNIKKITIGGNLNGMKFNTFKETSRVEGSRSGGLQTYWLAEAGEKLTSHPTFDQISLSLNKLIALCHFTDELLQDANSIDQIVTAAVNEEFEFKLVDSIINGTGSGQPTGILASAGTVDVNRGTADTVKYADILNMWSRMIASSRSKAIWFINQEVEAQLYQMSLTVGQGGSAVYLPPGGANDSPYGRLFGRPVVTIEQCSALGTLGDVILADLSQYVAIDRGKTQKDISMHLRFDFDESILRFVYRFDGQPILETAITPFKGSATVGHFVALDVPAV